MTPLLPSHTGASRRSTFGWLASTAASGLLVSGLAALAMSVQPGANSTGELDAAFVLMVPPVPALEAMSEPAPDLAASAPAEAAEPPPEAEDIPEPPSLTEAPSPTDSPVQPAPAPAEDMLAEAIPQVDSLVPMPQPAPPPQLEEPPQPESRAEQPPEPRPEQKPEAKPEPKPEKKRAEKAKAPKSEPKNTPAKKSAEESVGAQASKSAPAAQSSGGGAKAAANYGASVLKKISRTRKKSAGARGTVVVGFKVDANGGLASAWLAKSSGAAKLDQVALDHIQRSAPFPPPPEGAQRSFSFEFIGK